MAKKLVGLVTLVKVSGDMALMAQDILDAGAQGYAKVIGGNEHWIMLGTSTSITGYLTGHDEEKILEIMTRGILDDNLPTRCIDYPVERDSIVRLVIPNNTYSM